MSPQPPHSLQRLPPPTHRRRYRWLGAGLLGLTLWLFLITPQKAAEQNLLTNPGFEGSYDPLTECTTHIQGAVAPGWSDNTCWDPTAQIRYAQDTTITHSGAAAQRIQLNSGRVQFVQFISLQEGQLYTATVWLRAQSPMPVELVLRQTDAPYLEYIAREFTVMTEWQPFTLHGLTPTGDALFMLLTTTPGTFWVDDASLTSTAWSPTLPTATMPRSFFGMHIHSSTLTWPAVDEQIGTVRVWDADGPPVGAQWAAINTSPGVYDWRALDAHVERALAHQADVLMNLGRTPRWASARPDEPSPYGPGQAAEPATDQAWQDWVRAVGTRYRGKIKYWEVWNEPNVPDFYSGTPEKLVDLARQAYSILKAIDPANQLVSPSATFSIAYLDRYLTAGGGAYADIIGYHFYVDTAPEVLFTSYIPNLLFTLAAHGQQQKPLWNTEEGWLRPTPYGPQTLSPELGAAYLARAYLLNWASGVDRYYFYAWDNHGYMNIDLTEADSTTLTPAGIAYREVAHWLIGTRMNLLRRSADDTWTIRLRRSDGAYSYIVWHPTQTRTFTIPATWAVQRMRDLSGGTTAVNSGQTLSVGDQPILLEPTTPPPPPTPTVTPTPSPTPPTATPTPVSGCLISLNNGALFTNQRVVTVQSKVPNAAKIQLSNDGGFANAVWQTYQPALSWTLPDLGQRIATLVVHARFRNANNNLLCSGLAATDEIIYDPQAPTLQVALTPAHQLQIQATDQPNGSGVSDMQISTTGDFTDTSWQPWQAVIMVADEPDIIFYVRVRDGAGNESAVATLAPAASFELYLPLLQEE